MAATEFALIAPIILLVLIGMVDAGLYINTQMKLENAARAAAEFVYLGGDVADIEQSVLAQTDFADAETGALNNVTASADFVCECSGGVAASCDGGCDGYTRRFVEVVLSMKYKTIFPYPGLPDVIDLKGSVRYQVQ